MTSYKLNQIKVRNESKDISLCACMYVSFSTDYLFYICGVVIMASIHHKDHNKDAIIDKKCPR